MKRIIFIIFITIIIVIIPIKPVSAQQVSLSISPPIADIVIKPGKSILLAYTVKNLVDPATLTAYVLPFEPRDEYGHVTLKDQFEGPIRFDLDNTDIQMNKPFFVNSQESTQLLLKIRVPEGTPDGDYNYTLLVESKPNQGTEGISSGLATVTVGSHLLISVTNTGETKIQANINEFELIPHYTFDFLNIHLSFFDSSDTIPLRMTIHNKGLHRVQPQGTITLRGNFNERAEYTIVPVNILNDSIRLVEATPSASIEKPMSLVLSGFFVGRYKLTSEVNFGEGSPVLFANTSFIALPIKFLLGLIVGGAIIGFIIVKMKRRDED